MSIFVPGDTVVQREIEVTLHLGSVDVAADVRLRGDPLETETARDPAFLEANMKRRYYRMVLHHVIGPNIHPKLTVANGRFAHAMEGTCYLFQQRYRPDSCATQGFSLELTPSCLNRLHSVHEQQLQIDARPAAVGLPIKAAKTKICAESRGVSRHCTHKEGSARPSCFQSPSTAQCESSMKGCLKASITVVFFTRGSYTVTAYTKMAPLI